MPARYSDIYVQFFQLPVVISKLKGKKGQDKKHAEIVLTMSHTPDGPVGDTQVFSGDAHLL